NHLSYVPADVVCTVCLAPGPWQAGRSKHQRDDVAMTTSSGRARRSGSKEQTRPSNAGRSYGDCLGAQANDAAGRHPDERSEEPGRRFGRAVAGAAEGIGASSAVMTAAVRAVRQNKGKRNEGGGSI